MVEFEVLGGLLVVGLALATTFAAVAGLLGVVGAVRFARCERCGRLVIAKPGAPAAPCMYCRHHALVRPLYAPSHLHIGHPRLRRQH
jgi:DNA-directed RNA polymerase subunit RPC12/RpoP